jgi:hypothetical protein
MRIILKLGQCDSIVIPCLTDSDLSHESRDDDFLSPDYPHQLSRQLTFQPDRLINSMRKRLKVTVLRAGDDASMTWETAMKAHEVLSFDGDHAAA